MLDKETYKKELVRMWDESRSVKYKGVANCNGVDCDNCIIQPFCEVIIDTNKSYNAFEMIEAVEEWSKNHQKKYKVSKFEFDFLEENLKWVEGAHYLKFSEIMQLEGLLEKGYFKGATKEMNVKYYFDNCEVE